MAQIACGVGATKPLSMDIDKDGKLYAVNGLTRGVRYDGTTVLPIGITNAIGLRGVSTVSLTQNYVSDIVVENPGQNYIRPPVVWVSGTTNSFYHGLSGIRAVLRGGQVESVTFDTGRTSFGDAPEIELRGGQATGASIGVVTIGGVAEVDVSSGTTAWSAEPFVSFAAATGVTVVRPATARAVLHYSAFTSTQGVVSGIVVTDPGHYVVGPELADRSRPVTASLSPSNGASLTVRYSGYASTLTVSQAGSQYISPPQIKFVSRGPQLLGGGAIAACTATSGSVTGATVIQPGAGYDGKVVAELFSQKAEAKASIAPRFAGKYVGAYRYTDGSNNGDICDLVEVDCGEGAAGILWSGIRSPVAPDSFRVRYVDIWRSTSGQATTLYLVARLNVGSNGFLDTLNDEDLTDPTRILASGGGRYYTVTGVNVLSGGSGYSSTPTITFSSGDVTATGTVGVSAGAVTSVNVTSGGRYFAAIPTATLSGGGGSGAQIELLVTTGKPADFDAEAFTLPVLTPEGYPNAARFGVPPNDASIVCMHQDRAWYAGVASEPNAIYFSEQDEPESVPSAYQINLQTSGRDSDGISALFTLDSSLYIAQQRNIYRLTYSGHPLESASVSLVSNRGALNGRCTCSLDGVTYAADSRGVFIFNGGDADPISDTVANYWSDPIIDFAKSQWFFMQSDPRDRVVRFFFSQTGDAGNYPTRALCYSPVTKAWWTEKYAHAIGSAAIATSGGQQRCVLGSSNTMYRMGDGSDDAGTVIDYSFKTGNYSLNGDARRGLRLTYDPTASTHLIGVRAYYNGSTAARSNAAAADVGAGFVVTQGSTESVLNISADRSPLGKSNGYAQLYMAGRMDDKSAGGDRAIAFQVAGGTTQGRLVLHKMDVEGVG